MALENIEINELVKIMKKVSLQVYLILIRKKEPPPGLFNCRNLFWTTS